MNSLMRAKLWLFLIQFVFVSLATVAHGDVCYTVTDMYPGGGLGMNNAGQVVGGGPSNTATLWENGSVTYLGGVPGYNETSAEGISESGRYISGYSYYAGANDGRGVLWVDRVMTELPPLPGDAISAAIKVNDSGIAVGFSILSTSSEPRAVYWENGVPHELPGLGGGSGAGNINNAGTIVGERWRPDGSGGACLWINGIPLDLGVCPGYVYGWSRAISESGLVAVNLLIDTGERHVALWDNGVWTLADPLPDRPRSYVYGVNDLREMAGMAFVELTPEGVFVGAHAFVWQDGVTRDLNSLIPADSGWELSDARDINDHGQILGRGTHNGRSERCLLTPVPILTPELSGAATADVVYDPYGNVGGYAAGLPGGAEMVGGTTTLENFSLVGQFATLKLYYDEADLRYRQIVEGTLRLYWYDDARGQWRLAGNQSNVTRNRAARFVRGAATGTLGDWGIDVDGNYVWANVDHASVYGMAGRPTNFVEVPIDIKPGSADNPLNLGSEGEIPVAILGCETVNVYEINQGSLLLAGNAARVKGKKEQIGSFGDVDGDGYTDLIVHFPTEGLALTQADTSATVTGSLANGTPIEGSDYITVVPQ